MLEAEGGGGDSALTAPSLNRHPHTRAHTRLQTGQQQEEENSIRRAQLLLGQEKMLVVTGG